MFFRKSFIYLFALIALMSSCVSRKQLTYFQSITPESAKDINKYTHSQPEPTVKVNDALIIMVTALDLEAVLPYNLPSAPYVTQNSASEPTTSSYQYYIVDTEGNINFPVLGKLHVEGLTRAEVINMIQERLKEQVLNPVVTMRFLNANITILGEVRNPGKYSFNGQMTLLEALGAAGDLTQYGKRDNILLIRENGSNLEFARLNLNTDEIFKSPYFYLQQNDVIVVEPNQARSTSNQTIGLWLSMIGTVSSAATVVVSVMSAAGAL